MKTDSGMKEVCVLEKGTIVDVMNQDGNGFCEVKSTTLTKLIVKIIQENSLDFSGIFNVAFYSGRAP